MSPSPGTVGFTALSVAAGFLFACASSQPAPAVSLVTSIQSVSGCEALGSISANPSDLAAAMRVTSARGGNVLLLKDWRLGSTPTPGQLSSSPTAPGEVYHCQAVPQSEILLQ